MTDKTPSGNSGFDETVYRRTAVCQHTDKDNRLLIPVPRTISKAFGLGGLRGHTQRWIDNGETLVLIATFKKGQDMPLPDLARYTGLKKLNRTSPKFKRDNENDLA